MDTLISDTESAGGMTDDGHLHELKNRLTVIKGITQLLARQVLRSDWERERIVERVQNLHDEVVRLEMLVSQIPRGGQDSDKAAFTDAGQDTRPSH